MAEKKKIAAEFVPRYQKAGKREKARIPDEYLAPTGSKSRKKRVFQPYYDTEVAVMRELLGKNFNGPCGKRFAPFLRQNLDLIRLREKYLMPDRVAEKPKKSAREPLTGCGGSRNSG